jgi:Flp pilus assembly protein TadB
MEGTMHNPLDKFLLLVAALVWCMVAVIRHNYGLLIVVAFFFVAAALNYRRTRVEQEASEQAEDA